MNEIDDKSNSEYISYIKSAKSYDLKSLKTMYRQKINYNNFLSFIKTHLYTNFDLKKIIFCIEQKEKKEMEVISTLKILEMSKLMI